MSSISKSEPSAKLLQLAKALLAAVAKDLTAGERIWLKVPYNEKEKAKALGAQWDAKEKKWYCSSKREYLNVPYALKDKAKALGAKWDASAKKWYIPDNTAELRKLFT
jgi:hypothetical protein